MTIHTHTRTMCMSLIVDMCMGAYVLSLSVFMPLYMCLVTYTSSHLFINFVGRLSIKCIDRFERNHYELMKYSTAHLFIRWTFEAITFLSVFVKMPPPIAYLLKICRRQSDVRLYQQSETSLPII